MIYDISVTFEGDHVLARTTGEKNYAVVEEIWSRISRVCEKRRCFDVLGIANTSEPIEAVEGYDLPGVFREYNIDSRYRIAWVELNPDGVEVIELVASILENRDLPGRRFSTVDEARAWLLGNDEKR
ncbi:MAG: hypothetical protein ACR2QZ_05810 [Woeseiaceae bacterium]